MTSRLEKLLSYILVAPAVIPVVYVSGLVFPYVSTKTFLLQGFGIISLSVFVYLSLAGRSFFYGRLKSFLTWIPAALLIIAYVTSYFGIGFYHSFWGLFERGDGLLTSTVVTVYFYLILLSADRIFLERLVKTVTVVAGIVAIVAVLQWLTTLFGEKAAFLPPVTGRIGSTFGNAAFLAGYLGIAFFVSIIVLRDSNILWQRIAKTSAILSLFAIAFAATRGTILALFVAGGSALIFAAWKFEVSTKRMAKYALIALAVLSLFFFVFRTELSQSSFEPIRRVASISLSDGTVSSRLFVWSNILKEVGQHPISGYGAEHIAQLFDKVYDPSKITEQWFDRSHNAFLDYLAQYGLFGLAFYLAFLAAFIIYSLRLYKSEEKGPFNLGFLFLLLIVTYSVQNFFVFDTPSSLWLIYALLAFLIVTLSDEPAVQIQFKSLPAFAPVTCGAVVALSMIPLVALPFYANVLLTRGYLLHLINVDNANAYFERGLSLNTYADLEYGYNAYSMYTGHQAIQLSGGDRETAYKYALSLLTANFDKYPYDARTATYLGHVLDTTPPELTINDSFEQKVLERAIELSPLRAQAWYMMANIFLRTADRLPENDKNKEKNYRKAIAILEEYAKKETTFPVPRYILATLYYRLGDTVTAKKWADEGYPLYTFADAAAASPAVKYYLAVGDWSRAVRFLSDLVEDNPADHNNLYDLAKVTYLAGDKATALRIVEQLRTNAPDILGTDKNFLDAITNYEQSKK